MKPAPKVLIWLIGVLLLVALGIAASFWAFRQIEEAAAVRIHTNAALGGAHELLSSLKDAETGQRGYLLTGDEAFLEHYLAVRDNIDGDLKKLRQHTLLASAQKRLDTLAPWVDAKLAHMAQAIEQRRNQDYAAAIAHVRSGEGKRLMDAIRSEMSGYIQLEENLLVQREAEFQATMRQLLTLIVLTILIATLFGLAFAYLMYREAQQRIKNIEHRETRKLLELQEALNLNLWQANVKLQVSEENLRVTLNSIGDAVLATDEQGRITRMNPVAERLTGWTQAEAHGRLVDEIFHIINKETRLPTTIPVSATLAHGTIHGLANHTVLIARDASESDIADSCAPILDRDGQVVGAVLVFRDVTGEYETQHILQTQQVELEMQNEELRASQEALSALQARYFDLYNLAPMGYCTTTAPGLIKEANLTAATLLGLTRDELAQQAMYRFIFKEDAGIYYQLAKQLSDTHQQQTGELRMARADGTPVWVQLSIATAREDDATVTRVVMMDVSERKRTEEALLKAGALQRAIFNSANFSSIATDAKGVIQIFNVGAERMLGYAAADVMNKITPADISDPQEVIARAEALSVELDTPITPGFDALVFKASRGIEDIYELTYIRKDGSRFPAVVSVTALRDEQDAIIGYLLIGTDNTARQQIEAERVRLGQALLEQNIELESARAMAEKANLAKSDFLSSMSHELRTPLGAILGFAQLMESGTPPPTPVQLRSIDQILKAGWYLLELINEILDLALVESGKLSLSLEAVSLPEVMCECEAMIEPQAEKRGIKVTFTPFDGPCFVHADQTRVKQVVINLLSNAIKYNRPGGMVNIEHSLIAPNAMRVSVRDTGVGLTPEQITQLFQPFNRLGQQANVEEGTGIGLVVSKRLVELMHGEIGVESTPGQGSVFWFELNLTTQTPPAAHPAEPATLADTTDQTVDQRYSLLYVEDNPANLMLVEDLIARRSDIRFLSAKDGIHGVEIAHALRPNIILMDINLPGISGVEAMRILAKDPATARIPVIALSANAIPHDIEKGLQAGFFRYLTKPIKINELMVTLDLALKFEATTLATNKEEA
jgi:PAS domain S-box-containing protein